MYNHIVYLYLLAAAQSLFFRKTADRLTDRQ